MSVHQDKIDKIKSAPIPANRAQLTSFLGLASYYPRFIKGLPKIARPLLSNPSVNVEFKWTEDIRKAFGSLRDALCSAPILAFPDMAKPFVVSTDDRLRHSAGCSRRSTRMGASVRSNTPVVAP